MLTNLTSYVNATSGAGAASESKWFKIIGTSLFATCIFINVAIVAVIGRVYRKRKIRWEKNKWRVQKFLKFNELILETWLSWLEICAWLSSTSRYYQSYQYSSLIRNSRWNISATRYTSREVGKACFMQYIHAGDCNSGICTYVNSQIFVQRFCNN